MVEITSALVKELRKQTGAGMMDCKKALTECDGNLEQAVVYLREKGLSKAASKFDRTASEGIVESYLHHNRKIGVLLELCCETDFVARNENFQSLAKDICLHIAASNPSCIDREDLDQSVLESEKAIYLQQAINEGKKPEIAEKIASGKLEKFYQEVCLLEQNFVKNPDKTIAMLIQENIAIIGEKIEVRRFVRFQLGA